MSTGAVSADIRAPKPTCCEAIQKYPVILATLVDIELGTDKSPAQWCIATMSPSRHGEIEGYEEWSHSPFRVPTPTCCPFCGTPLPKLVRVDPEPPGLEKVTDGGYYCDNCQERCGLGCHCKSAICAFTVETVE